LKALGREVEEIDSKDNLIRLMQQYQNLVFSICLKMTGDYFVAEDIAQETFLSVFKHYEEFDGQNAKAWICRIATNKCIDYLKSSSRKEMVVEDKDREDIADTGSDEPLNLYLSKEVMEDFLKKCNELPEQYREVAIEHFYKGKTAKAIASAEGIGLKTIQTRIYRARQMLQKTMRMEDYA